ncbi:MAG: helix-turn-helix domain-containing protein [Verrucomicrobiota bacterium]
MVKQRSTNGEDLDRVFHALADPTRRHLLEVLGQEEQTVGQLAEPLSISLPAVS